MCAENVRREEQESDEDKEWGGKKNVRVADGDMQRRKRRRRRRISAELSAERG